MKTSDRFWKKVRRGGPDECWPWLAGKSSFGHGRFKIGGQLFSAHRVAFVLAGGEIEPLKMNQYHGTVIRHTCDNPGCCNPAHLIQGTQYDNAKDMARRGRGRKICSCTVSAPN